MEDVPIPELEPGDILLRVDAALLCGTDVRIYNGSKQKNVTFPTVLGHEFAGTVVDANGPLPDGLEIGAQVAVYPLVTCGPCAACRKGHENICQNRQAFGYQLTGGLSQYVRVPAVARQNLVPVPGVSAAQAAIIEPVACAYNGQKLAGMQRAETALIVGCGPLGLIHTGLAKNSACSGSPPSTRSPDGATWPPGSAPTWCSSPAPTPPRRSTSSATAGWTSW